MINMIRSTFRAIKTLVPWMTDVKSQLSSIESRISQTENWISNTESRMNSTETRISQTENWIRNEESRMSSIESRISQTETLIRLTELKIHDIDKWINDAGTWMSSTESRISQTETLVRLTESRISDTESRISQTESRIHNTEKWINDAGTWMNSTESRISQTQNWISNAESRLTETRGNIDLINNILMPNISIINPDSKVMVDDRFNYYNFEDVFRGNEEVIKQRQRVFLPLFSNKENILDLGSGRGEFLEILKEEGLKGTGIDFDMNMVTRCQKKGLDVSYGDIEEYLNMCPDESIDGIFSSQVIEHLAFEKLDRVIRIVFKKLKNEGVFVVETVNPYNLLSFRLFYLDPSHQKPLFPEFISFICNSSGFNDVKINYISMDSDLSNDSSKEQLNKWICGDYAIIARKSP